MPTIYCNLLLGLADRSVQTTRAFHCHGTAHSHSCKDNFAFHQHSLHNALCFWVMIQNSSSCQLHSSNIQIQCCHMLHHHHYNPHFQEGSRNLLLWRATCFELAQAEMTYLALSGCKHIIVWTTQNGAARIDLIRWLVT